MRYLADTNILVYVLNTRPNHQKIIERFRALPASDMVVSSISVAELQFGIAKSNRADASKAALRRLPSALNVVPFDEWAAEVYGQVRSTLESSGTPIGPLDTLIAAHALSLNLTVVTNNEREFSRVNGLRVENWAA